MISKKDNGNNAVRIRKAVVLAAGLGTRLRPFTCVTPKPLMPVWGVTMLDRVVEMLREWGVNDVIVNCHYLHGQVEDWTAAFNRAEELRPAEARMTIGTSYEPEILGTGGVLNPLRGWIGDEPFYLVNGDIVTENCPAPRLAPRTGRAPGANCLAACIVTEDGPRTIEVEPESGFVTNWRSNDPGFPGSYTYCGIAALDPKILDYVPASGFSSIVDAYESAMADGLFVRAVAPEDLLWTDAGAVGSYIELNCAGKKNAFADLPQLADALAAIGATPSTEVSFLGARGSDRVFFKFTEAARASVAILYDDARRAENARYASHAKWLASHGVKVPEVLADLPDRKSLVMAWGGSERKRTLEDAVKAVEALAAFSRLGDAAAEELSLEPPFSPGLWKWERDLFAEHCLGSRYRRELSEAVRDELENVAALLEREPKALVHRDFQSTNILWKNQEIAFIDFQGMRLGPGVYDLASYLYDPYETLPSEGERRALVKLYAKEVGRDDVARIVPFAAVQRLAQCLGAYGRLASVGQPQFLQYVLPALENLLVAADEAGLDAVGALAEDLIAEEQRLRERTKACSCGHYLRHGDEDGRSCACGGHHQGEHSHTCTCGGHSHGADHCA